MSNLDYNTCKNHICKYVASKNPPKLYSKIRKNYPKIRTNFSNVSLFWTRPALGSKEDLKSIFLHFSERLQTPLYAVPLNSAWDAWPEFRVLTYTVNSPRSSESRRSGSPPKTRCDHLPKNSPVGFFTGIRLQDLSYYPAVRILILSPYFRTAMNNSRPMIRYTTDMI